MRLFGQVTLEGSFHERSYARKVGNFKLKDCQEFSTFDGPRRPGPRASPRGAAGAARPRPASSMPRSRALLQIEGLQEGHLSAAASIEIRRVRSASRSASRSARIEAGSTKQTISPMSALTNHMSTTDGSYARNASKHRVAVASSRERSRDVVLSSTPRRVESRRAESCLLAVDLDSAREARAQHPTLASPPHRDALAARGRHGDAGRER